MGPDPKQREATATPERRPAPDDIAPTRRSPGAARGRSCRDAEASLSPVGQASRLPAPVSVRPPCDAPDLSPAVIAKLDLYLGTHLGVADDRSVLTAEVGARVDALIERLQPRRNEIGLKADRGAEVDRQAVRFLLSQAEALLSAQQREALAHLGAQSDAADADLLRLEELRGIFGQWALEELGAFVGPPLLKADDVGRIRRGFLTGDWQGGDQQMWVAMTNNNKHLATTREDGIREKMRAANRARLRYLQRIRVALQSEEAKLAADPGAAHLLMRIRLERVYEGSGQTLDGVIVTTGAST